MVLSCQLPLDMWLLPDNPMSQHVYVCVHALTYNGCSLLPPWDTQQAMTSASGTSRTQVIKSKWFITQLMGGGLLLRRVRFGVRLPLAEVCMLAASLLNNLEFSHITPLPRVSGSPLNYSFPSILWSPLGNHWAEQEFECLVLWVIFCISLLHHLLSEKSLIFSFKSAKF